MGQFFLAVFHSYVGSISKHLKTAAFDIATMSQDAAVLIPDPNNDDTELSPYIVHRDIH